VTEQGRAQRHLGEPVSMTSRRLATELAPQASIMVIGVDASVESDHRAAHAIRILGMMGAKICRVDSDKLGDLAGTMESTGRNVMRSGRNPSYYALINKDNIHNADMLKGLAALENIMVRVVTENTTWSGVLTDLVSTARRETKVLINETADSKLERMLEEEGRIKIAPAVRAQVSEEQDKEFLSELESELAY